MTDFEQSPERPAPLLTVDITGAVPPDLLARTVHTATQTRLYTVLVAAVCVLCAVPLVTLFVALDTTLRNYGWLFYVLLAVQLVAAAGVIMRLTSVRRAAVQAAADRDAGDVPRTAALTEEGIAVTAPDGQTVLRYADITRVYETREGLLLYCLGLHLWLPADRLTQPQCKALRAALYARLRPTCVRTVPADLQGERMALADLPDIAVPQATVLTAPYADACAQSGRDTRNVLDSLLGAAFIGSALATLVFPEDPLLPAAIGAVVGLILLYGLFSGIQRVNAASARRKSAKKQVYNTCTAYLSETGCCVYADGLPLLPPCPLSAVTVDFADGGVQLTVNRTVLLFPATDIPKHLLERMNISHG